MRPSMSEIAKKRLGSNRFLASTAVIASKLIKSMMHFMPVCRVVYHLLDKLTFVYRMGDLSRDIITNKPC